MKARMVESCIWLHSFKVRDVLLRFGAKAMLAVSKWMGKLEVFISVSGALSSVKGCRDTAFASAAGVSHSQV